MSLALSLWATWTPVHGAEEVRFERIYALDPDVSVFAYARISASGRYLVFSSVPPDDKIDPRALRPLPPRAGASDRPQGYAIMEMLQVVDLQTRKILFSEPGIDGFWSNDEQRVIFSSTAGRQNVSIWNRQSSNIVRDIAPNDLGGYFSWGVRNGRDVILTILGHYFYLDEKGFARLPTQRVAECPDMGLAERPLISRDGRRITAFVGGTLVVRNLTDCREVFNTGVAGAKADFSWNGRYIAFHAPKRNAAGGYEVKVIDTRRRTVRTITNFAGSSLFPSWTRDGRLCFRYEGKDFNGFMMADHVLAAPEEPLPAASPIAPRELVWSHLFPETPAPQSSATLVLIWAPWSAYSATALTDMQRARDHFRELEIDIGAMTATDPASSAADVERVFSQNKITLPSIPLAPGRFVLTDAVNQIPTTLLFYGDRLIDRRLGAQSFQQLLEWTLGDGTGAR